MFAERARSPLQESCESHKAGAYHPHFCGMDHMKLLDWYVDTFAARTARGRFMSFSPTPPVVIQP